MSERRTRAILVRVVPQLDELLAQARAVLERSPEIDLAVLFGSFARATARPDSDVDIAVVWGSPAPKLARELALQAELERAVGRAVDLVSIANATTPLRWRIVRDGLPICMRDANAWKRLRVAIAIEHDDFRETFERALARQRARLIAGGTR
jgi:predicted nucleotidyltransferase